MGRPRQHDEHTRAALRAAAERLVAEGGVAAFSVRAVADEVGTTTRAVYSLFGSGDGLLVDALAQGAFDFLAEGIDELVETDDPEADLIAVGVPVFRSLVLEHPALYRIAFQRIVPGFRAGPEVTAARERAWARLTAKVQRLEDAGRLHRKSVREAAVEFNAMLEGLANAELRGGTLRLLPEGAEEETWRNALTTVYRGFLAGNHVPSKDQDRIKPG
jgi:AcrR family transcriptional regulator